MQSDGPLPAESGQPVTEPPQTSSSGTHRILTVEPVISTTGVVTQGSAATGDCWIDGVIVQEAARLRALRTQARLLGSEAMSPALEGVRAYVRRRAEGPSAIVHGARDKRNDLSPEQKALLLDQLCAASAQGTPRTLLIVAHQDDECIGAGARLCKLDDAMIVHVTNGAPRDPEFARRAGYSNRDDYEEARRMEAVQALRMAGIQPDQIVGLDMMDGEASYHLVELSLEIADLIDELRPEVVVTHPYEGGHTDHDATAFAVHLACGLLRRDGASAPAVLELTSYHTKRGIRTVGDFLPAAGIDARTVDLTLEEQALKAHMFAAYRSQRRCLEPFPLDFERFRPAPRYIFTQPPHPGRLNYERYTKKRPMTGDEWRDHAKRALRALRSGRRLLVGGALLDQPQVMLTRFDIRVPEHPANVESVPQLSPPTAEVAPQPESVLDAA